MVSAVNPQSGQEQVQPKKRAVLKNPLGEIPSAQVYVGESLSGRCDLKPPYCDKADLVAGPRFKHNTTK